VTERCKSAIEAREAVLPARRIGIAINTNCAGEGQLAGCFPLVLRVKAHAVQLDPDLVNVPKRLAKVGVAVTDAVHELTHGIDAESPAGIDTRRVVTHQIPTEVNSKLEFVWPFRLGEVICDLVLGPNRALRKGVVGGGHRGAAEAGVAPGPARRDEQALEVGGVEGGRARVGGSAE